MPRWSRVFRMLLAGMLLAFFTAACQFDLGISELNLPFMPTETSPPVPTATPIPTPTVPPKPSSSADTTQIQVMVDDTTVFTDKQLGFRLVLPPEWMAVPVDETLRDEIIAGFAGNLRESLARLLESAMTQEGLRMLAVDYTGKYTYQEENFINNIQMVFDESANPEAELQTILDDAVASAEETFEDSDVLYQSIEENSKGITYASLIISHPISTFGVPLRQVLMMIKLDTGLLTITASIHAERYTDAERSLKNVINSFELAE
ncbi:MAG: hypothetical protein JW757_13390 [Anaerolineales bacterium]|nr:hypothetical protein [Anaerolineales bacterium]